MILEIYFKSARDVELKLVEDSEVKDVYKLPLDNQFDTLLVTSIDKILERNRIDLVSINEVRVQQKPEKLNPNATSLKIALAVKAAIESGRK